MTARGMVRSGLRASEPRVVADSKPTKLKMASITPRPMPRGDMVARFSWGWSKWRPWRRRSVAVTMAMRVTEMPSMASMRRAETLTS